MRVHIALSAKPPNFVGASLRRLPEAKRDVGHDWQPLKALITLLVAQASTTGLVIARERTQQLGGSVALVSLRCSRAWGDGGRALRAPPPEAKIRANARHQRACPLVMAASGLHHLGRHARGLHSGEGARDNPEADSEYWRRQDASADQSWTRGMPWCLGQWLREWVSQARIGGVGWDCGLNSRAKDLALTKSSKGALRNEEKIELPEFDLGHYQWVGEIGQGMRGITSLYERIYEIDRGPLHVVVKQAHAQNPYPGKEALGDTQQDIDEEIQVFMQLNKPSRHPSIVKAMGTAIVNGTRCLVLEQVKGVVVADSEAAAHLVHTHWSSFLHEQMDMERLVQNLKDSMYATAIWLEEHGVTVHDKAAGNFMVPFTYDDFRDRQIIWIDMGTRNVGSKMDANVENTIKLLKKYLNKLGHDLPE